MMALTLPLPAEVINTLITTAGIIVVAWITHRQHRRNKQREAQMDIKIEDYKSKLKERSTRDVESIAIIYGKLWDGLSELKTDRMYIIQPHPSHANRYVTITMEVKKRGVSPMKPYMQSLPMSDIAHFVSILAREKFINFDDVSMEIIDKEAKSIMGVAGVLSMSIHRLENTEGKWIGNIICEHTQKQCWKCGKCEHVLEELARIIAPILPDYESNT